MIGGVGCGGLARSRAATTRRKREERRFTFSFSVLLLFSLFLRNQRPHPLARSRTHLNTPLGRSSGLSTGTHAPLSAGGAEGGAAAVVTRGEGRERETRELAPSKKERREGKAGAHGRALFSGADPAGADRA